MYGNNLVTAKRLNDIVHNCNVRDIKILDEFANDITQNLKVSVIIVDSSGWIMSASEGVFESLWHPGAPDERLISRQLNRQLNGIYSMRENFNLSEYSVNTTGVVSDCALVVPLYSGGVRLGTAVFAGKSSSFTEDEYAYTETIAALMSLVLHFLQNEDLNIQNIKMGSVKSAISTLSYSELEAVVYIVKELGAMEGRLVSSHIADKIGVTRSVIVNALRKLESAGVLESRSLGMKGTYIKILNRKLLDEIKAYSK